MDGTGNTGSLWNKEKAGGRKEKVSSEERGVRSCGICLAADD